MNEPHVSVLLPTYNRAGFLGEAVASALAQRDADLELVVVDDGSTDATPDVLAAVADRRMRVIRQENRGIGAALNAGLRAARGRLVGCLGSDDRWLPELTEALAPRVAYGVGVAYGRARAMDEAGRPLPLTTGAPPRFPGRMRASLLYGDHLSAIAALARREDVLREGGWDERLVGSEDWDLWLRLARTREFAYVDRVVAEYRVHPGRISGPRSERFAMLVADRARVLDRALAADDSAEARAVRPTAYRNLHIDLGLRWLSAGGRAQAFRHFALAVFAAPDRAAAVARLAARLIYMRGLVGTRAGALAARALAARRTRAGRG